MVKPPSEIMARALRTGRVRAGLTQEQLARLIDMSPRTVRAIERGDVWPSSSTFDAWMRAVVRPTPGGDAAEVADLLMEVA